MFSSETSAWIREDGRKFIRTDDPVTDMLVITGAPADGLSSPYDHKKIGDTFDVVEQIKNTQVRVRFYRPKGAQSPVFLTCDRHLPHVRTLAVQNFMKRMKAIYGPEIDFVLATPQPHYPIFN